MNKKKKDWREEKAKLLSMSLEERQRQYRAEHVTLDKILTWRQMREAEEDGNNLLMDKVSLYKGDITALEVDAIVNAANSSLLGGGGVDGCIHKAAGPLLFDECHTLHGCDTGNAKITCGYDLPAKYVIHTVGPVARGSVGPTENRDLAACYKKSLQLAKDNDLHSVAFPCISTGIYGFPNEPAANIALSTVKNWLKNNSQMERVIFCVFLDMDYKIYKDKLSQFFPDNEESGEENDRELKEGDPVPPEQQDQTEDIHEDKGIKAEDSELEKDLPAKKEEVGEEEKGDDVAMQSQQQDTPDPPEENGRKDTSAGEHDGETTHPGEEETGSSAMVAAEEEEEEKMETGSSQEPSVLDDKPVDCVSREVEMKASTEGLQGSDLTQTDSTQSKDLENNE